MRQNEVFLDPVSKVRLLVVVDAEGADPLSSGRSSFWTKACAKIAHPISVTEVSIVEHHEAGIHVDIDRNQWDVVVLNWDVADGDPKFRSDETKKIISYHYQDDFRDFVRDGGIVLIEAQTSYWSPDQEAYDAILGPGELKVGPKERFARSGRSATLGQAHLRHPVALDLPTGMTGNFVAEPEALWFPPGSVSARVIERNDPHKLHAGHFLSWKSSWMPILYDEAGNPILLIKNDGSGFFVATTMFVASSTSTALIRSVLIDGLRRRTAIKEYHSRVRFLRILGWIALPLLLALIGYAFARVAKAFGASPSEMYLAALTGFIAPWLVDFVSKRYLKKLFEPTIKRLLNK